MCLIQSEPWVGDALAYWGVRVLVDRAGSLTPGPALQRHLRSPSVSGNLKLEVDVVFSGDPVYHLASLGTPPSDPMSQLFQGFQFEGLDPAGSRRFTV